MASDKVTFDFSGGWDEVIRYCIEFNTETHRRQLSVAADIDESTETHLQNCIKLNDKLLSTLEKYTSEDGKVTLYTSEVRRLVWLLLENEILRTE